MDVNISFTMSTLAKNMASYIPEVIKVEQACSGEMKKKITAVREGMVKDSKTMEDMLKQAESNLHDPNEIKKMQETVDRIREDYEDGQKTIARLEKEIFRLDEKIESHESKISTLENDVQAIKTELRKMRYTLSTGQIAFTFEKDLALYVYPTNKKYGSDKIFTKMKEWLKENEKTPQGEEANAKWNALQEKASWSPMHENMLKKLRYSRTGLAHPSLHLETAKSQIPDDLFNAEEKKCIEDIIDIIKEVNDRM